MIIRTRTKLLPSSLSSHLIHKSLVLPNSSRHLHASMPQPPIPPPTPFVPDPPTFLTLIGRQLSQHASKIPTWDALFSLTSSQLRDLGVEPARTRRYLLWWRDKFRRGEYGPGGDLQEVVDGVGEVKMLETEGGKKVVVNTKPGDVPKEGMRRVKGFKVEGAGTVVGPWAELVKGTRGRVARVAVKEGMWAVARGKKIHGGERRRKNVLSRIAARERGTLNK